VKKIFFNENLEIYFLSKKFSKRKNNFFIKQSDILIRNLGKSKQHTFRKKLSKKARGSINRSNFKSYSQIIQPNNLKSKLN